MKSRTSFFNLSVLRKDITRFAPAWGLYLVMMVLMVVNAVSSSQPSAALTDVEILISVMAFFNLGYGLIAAQLLFGDLFNTRLCNALHAMPLRREGWFYTHLAAGMCFSIGPNLVAALLMLPRLGWYWSAAFVWLGAVTLQYLFFFAVAVFCVMCTGSRFAMAVIYGLINFGAFVAWWFVDTIYEPLLYGIEINSEVFLNWCPLYRLSQEGWFNGYDRELWARFGLGEGWPYLFGMSLLALGLLALSLGMYRRRKLECAGDFVAVRPLSPVFLVVYTLTVAAVFAWLDDVFFGNGDGIFLFVGLTVGYVTGRMLLERTVRVFRWKMVLGGLAIGGALLVSMLVTWLDPTGMTRWVPAAERVESVSIDTYGYYYSGVNVADPDDIQTLVSIHRELVKDGSSSGYNTTKLGLSYKLEDGSTVSRTYYFSTEDYAHITRKLRSILSRPEAVLGYDNWEEYIAGVYRVELSTIEIYAFESDEARSFMEAVKKDCEAGRMCQNWGLRDENTGNICWVNIYQGGGYKGDISIFSDCEHTLKWLEEHGVTLEDFSKD